ncbi:hypothetical protein ACVDFE_00070 [Lentzea chajnantorensis]
MAVNLITLDGADDHTLATSLAALDKDTRDRLRHAMTALNERDDIDALIELVHEELDPREPVIGVLFAEHREYDQGRFLDDAGVVAFADGNTRTVTFTRADDLLSDLFGPVSDGFTVALDLRTGLMWGDAGSDPHRAFQVAAPADRS